MCGLIFCCRYDKKSARRIIAKRFQKQKKRGTLGFGFLGAQDWTLKSWKRSENEFDILKDLEQEQSNIILFHHRMPTSTPNLEEATHPIEVTSDTLKYTYFFIHNGVITNARKLRPEHEKIGFTYTTDVQNVYRTKEKEYIGDIMFNDSESLAIELALYIEEKKKQVEAQGSMAFIGYQVDKETKEIVNVFYGRNAANPLKLNSFQGIMVLASEGQGTEVDSHKLFRFNPKEQKTYEQELSFWYSYPKGGYHHSKSYTDRDGEDDFEYMFGNRDADRLPFKKKIWDKEYDLHENKTHKMSHISEIPLLGEKINLSELDINHEEEDFESELDEDAEAALIYLYEDKAKYEDWLKAAEGRNDEITANYMKEVLVEIVTNIAVAEKFLADLELDNALKGGKK